MLPSIKTIESRLHNTLAKEYSDTLKVAKEIRKQLESATSHNRIDKALEEINKLLHGYGVEPVRDNEFSGYYCDIGLLYVNMGDTYDMTVIYDTRNDSFKVCSWGDIVERDMNRFNI